MFLYFNTAVVYISLFINILSYMYLSFHLILTPPCDKFYELVSMSFLSFFIYVYLCQSSYKAL